MVMKVLKLYLSFIIKIIVFILNKMMFTSKIPHWLQFIIKFQIHSATK